MKKNIISSLQNIGDFLNDKMLNKLGWNNLEVSGFVIFYARPVVIS